MGWQVRLVWLPSPIQAYIPNNGPLPRATNWQQTAAIPTQTRTAVTNTKEESTRMRLSFKFRATRKAATGVIANGKKLPTNESLGPGTVPPVVPRNSTLMPNKRQKAISTLLASFARGRLNLCSKVSFPIQKSVCSKRTSGSTGIHINRTTAGGESQTGGGIGGLNLSGKAS